MFIAALGFMLHRSWEDFKELCTPTPAAKTERPVVGIARIATSDRGTRQLTVNPLYFTRNLTLHYTANSGFLADFRSSSLWGQDVLSSSGESGSSSGA